MNATATIPYKWDELDRLPWLPLANTGTENKRDSRRTRVMRRAFIEQTPN
jgi:hypothetical protein